MAIKSNRVVALSAADKAKVNFTSIESLELEGRAKSVYLKQYDNPALIGNKSLKTGTVVRVRFIWPQAIWTWNTATWLQSMKNDGK